MKDMNVSCSYLLNFFQENIMARDKHPWVGNPSKTSEPSLFGGRIYYLQVPYYNGEKRKTKKIYYEPYIDGAEQKAMKEAQAFIKKKKEELNIAD